MNFPRELMRITEIERECKVSRKLLLQAYLTPGQNFAFRAEGEEKKLCNVGEVTQCTTTP